MRVTPLQIHQSGKDTTFSADFIFSRPHGGKKAKLAAWLRWLQVGLSNPAQMLRFGGSVRRTIWYTLPTAYAQPQNAANAFFLIALPLAIAAEEDLLFEPAVSADLIKKSEQVQEYYAEMMNERKSLRQVKVTAKAVPIQAPQGVKQEGQFFTLGVDSFYSLCCSPKKHMAGQLRLIYVDGYDIPFYEKLLLQTIHKNIRAVARATQTQAVYVSTNLRQVSDEILGWGRFHVSALVAVANLLGLKKIFISGESFDSPDWGLRSGVDRLYSRASCKVELVAHHVSREWKIKKLVQSPDKKLFLRFVRVCWENVRRPDLPYNCSQCQKCLKTQLSLLALDVTKPPTFLPLNSSALEKIQLVEHVYPEWQMLFQQLKKKKNVPPQLLTAMDTVLQKPLRT